MDLVQIWRNVLNELEVSLSTANYQTWFRGAFLADFKKGYFTIGAPNIFFENWLKRKYLKEIQNALQKQVTETVVGIKFKIASPPPEFKNILQKSRVIHSPVDNSEPARVNANRQKSLIGNNLNEDYKFNDFIVGPSNQLAHAAALAVASRPGSQYNPLFIYGNSGLGKTHLIQAIGHAFLEKSPGKQVLYISSETFINDFITAVEAGHGRAKDFKDRYRNVDLLLIDDIQFLSRKESTQDEFFHTFNHLHQNKKQVVLTADTHPKSIRGLEIRLQTRFEGGMVTDISQPDLETREAILRHKARKHGVHIEPEVIRFIAENIHSSIRELEGVLTKIIATCELKNVPIDTDCVNEILGEMIKERRQTITPDLIMREIHRHFKVPIDDILGKRRTKELVLPRQIAMFLLKSEGGLSFPDIGRIMGGKDHSTVIHGYRKIESELNKNDRVKDDILMIKERIYTFLR
ncbi:MAG: chromosomal replication initiator protein DnaA [Patescibacteria group bacterium]